MVGYRRTYLGRVVVHVAHPALPARRDPLALSWEPLSVFGELNEATLVLVLAVPVLVVAVAVLVSADAGSELITETSLLVSRPKRLTAEDSPHQTLFAVDLPELWAHHADGHTPRSHFSFPSNLLIIILL